MDVHGYCWIRKHVEAETRHRWIDEYFGTIADDYMGGVRSWGWSEGSSCFQGDHGCVDGGFCVGLEWGLFVLLVVGVLLVYFLFVVDGE